MKTNSSNNLTLNMNSHFAHISGVKNGSAIEKDTPKAKKYNLFTKFGNLTKKTDADVKVSDEGLTICRKLRQANLETTQKELKEADEDNKRIMKISLKLQQDEELTEEDKGFIDDGLLELTTADYVEKRNRYLNLSEIEGVLEKNDKKAHLDYELVKSIVEMLRGHFIQRVNMYSDIQRDIITKMHEDEQDSTNQKIAKAMEEDEEGKGMLKVMKETLEDEEDKEGEVEEKKDSEDAEDSQEVSEEQEAEEAGKLEFEDESEDEESDDEMDWYFRKGINLINRNEEKLYNMGNQYKNETRDMMEADRAMDEEYLRISNLLTNEEISRKEKMAEYETSKEHMNQLYANKLYSQIASYIDYETWANSKIELQHRDQVKEILRSENERQKGWKVIPRFLYDITLPQ